MYVMYTRYERLLIEILVFFFKSTLLKGTMWTTLPSSGNE